MKIQEQNQVAFERSEIVRFVRPVRHGVIHAGMVGKVTDVFGTPPAFYAVEVPEARSWAIVPPDALELPPYESSSQERSLRARVAVDLGLLVGTGRNLKPELWGFALGPFPQRVYEEAVRDALTQPHHVWARYRVGKGFEGRFGTAIEAMVGVPGLDGCTVDLLVGFLFQPARGDESDKVIQLYSYPAAGLAV